MPCCELVLIAMARPVWPRLWLGDDSAWVLCFVLLLMSPVLSCFSVYLRSLCWWYANRAWTLWFLMKLLLWIFGCLCRFLVLMWISVPVFVRVSGSIVPPLLLCFAGCIYSAGWGLGFEQNFQGLGRRKQICSSIWDTDEPEVDEAETVGFGRKKDYLIWTKIKIKRWRLNNKSVESLI